MKIKLFTIPNVITCMNLLCGCGAVVTAFNSDLALSFWLIIIAALFDFLDGFAARALNAYSEIGKQLDSLADDISFGFAPAAILFSLMQNINSGSWINYIVFVVAAFSALRLAKFNIDERQTNEFIGLPTPANALFIASLGWISTEGNVPFINAMLTNSWAIIAISIVMSLLLVCEIPMFALKFKTFSFSKNVLPFLFLGATLIAVVVFGLNALPFVIATYILISIVKFVAMPTKKSGDNK